MLKIDESKMNKLLKESLLGQSDKIACHKCDKPYCCRNQQAIQISTTEFESKIKQHLITDIHIARAKAEKEKDLHMDELSVYTCPFNNPDTGECEIYDNRFIVCAGHGVVAEDVEVCNTETSKDGTMIVNPFNTLDIAIKKDEEMFNYIQFHATLGEPTDLLEAFNPLIDLM